MSFPELSKKFEELLNEFSLDATDPRVETLAQEFVSSTLALARSINRKEIPLGMFKPSQALHLLNLRNYLGVFGVTVTVKPIDEDDAVIGVRINSR
jgi:hypothetical protein